MIGPSNSVDLLGERRLGATRPFTDIAERLLQAAEDLRRQTASQPSPRKAEILELADRLESIAADALARQS